MAGDEPAIAAVFAESWRAAYTPIAGAEAVERLIREAAGPERQAAWLGADGRFAIVALREGVVCGVVMGLPRWKDGAMIQSLYVSPRVQGAGIGAALLAAFSREHPGPLYLSVIRANTRAHAFYRREGFVDYGADVFDLGGVPVPIVMLRRDPVPPPGA